MELSEGNLLDEEQQWPSENVKFCRSLGFFETNIPYFIDPWSFVNNKIKYVKQHFIISFLLKRTFS